MDAWVFFGGGSRIFLMLGYLQGGLNGKPLPKRFYGTSAGALLASLIAFLGIEKATELIMSIVSANQIFPVKDVPAIVGDEIFRNRPGLATYKPLLALIQNNIKGTPSLRVTIKRTLFKTGAPQYVTAMPDGSFITEGDQSTVITDLAGFQDALCSSCINAGAVDAFQDSKDNFWIDGGYNDLGDTSKAIADGAKDITLLMTGQFSDPALNNQSGDVISSIIDGYSILVHRVMRADVLLAVKNPDVTVTIYEATPVGSSSAFVPKDDATNLDMGKATISIDGKTLITASA